MALPVTALRADCRRPIPVPTLDEFILLHKLLQAAVARDPGMLGLLRGATRSFGWNVLGGHGMPAACTGSRLAMAAVSLHAETDTRALVCLFP